MASNAPSFPDASACCPPSSLIVGNGLLSAISSRLLSLVADDGLLSAVSGRLSSPITGSGSSSTILGCLLSLVAGVNPLSNVSGRFLSLVAGDGSLSAVLGCFLFLFAGDGLLSAISGRPLSLVPTANFRTLSLTSTPSCARHSSLPSSPLFHFSLSSLPTPLARNPALLTGKRLFDQAFITQRPITSI